MTDTFDIKHLIQSATVIPDLAAADKSSALDELLAAAQETGAFLKKSTKALRGRLAEREAMGSTGIGNGVAVPHVKGDEVSDICMVLARSVDGIEFHAIDGRPVHTLFLLLAPASRADVHLQCLRWISTLARSADFRRFFLDSSGEAEIRDLLEEMSPSGT